MCCKSTAFVLAVAGLVLAGQASAGVYDLTIEKSTVNITGRDRPALTVNGAIPGPVLRWREGEEVTINVTNRLEEPTSIHWHGLLVPANMDGVPVLSFDGIEPGETFTYSFRVKQAGTYWYHSHSGLQEQAGVYGPLVIEPAGKEPYAYDREYVLLLSDWTDEDPHRVLSKLKKQSDYYNRNQRTVFDFFRDVSDKGWDATVADRLAWGEMRMDPTDIADVTGYSFLVNGQPPGANWTATFKPGERVRLRFINGSAMSFFDVRIPGLKLQVVQADGQDVEPVTVDEFRIAVAETYDVIVQPKDGRAYTIFAESMDRSGYARGTLAPAEGMSAPIPEMKPRNILSMADMGGMHGGMGGMSEMAHGKDGGMEMQHGAASQPSQPSGAMPMTPNQGALTSMADHKEHGMAPAKDTGMQHGMAGMSGMAHGNAGGAEMQHGTAGQSMAPHADAPTGMADHKGRGVPAKDTGMQHGTATAATAAPKTLSYNDLRAVTPNYDTRSPGREIVLRLTGNMERYFWSINDKKFSQAEPIQLRHGERVRLTFVNETMMNHPMHLHGMWMELDNGNGAHNPRKHVINVPPGQRHSVDVTADALGDWAFHCHLLYHVDTGMFRTVTVAKVVAEATR